MRRNLNADPERIFIAFAVVAFLIGQFILSEHVILFNKITVALIMLLGFWYGYTLKNKEGILCVVTSISFSFQLLDKAHEWFSYFYWGHIFILTISGILLLFKAIEESKRNKDFEMFATLVALAFFYPLLHQLYFLQESGFKYVYHIAFVFLIGYVMYYENLWDKYNAGEKKLLLLWLVFNLFEIGVLSLS